MHWLEMESNIAYGYLNWNFFDSIKNHLFIKFQLNWPHLLIGSCLRVIFTQWSNECEITLFKFTHIEQATSYIHTHILSVLSTHSNTHAQHTSTHTTYEKRSFKRSCNTSHSSCMFCIINLKSSSFFFI